MIVLFGFGKHDCRSKGSILPVELSLLIIPVGGEGIPQESSGKYRFTIYRIL